MTYRSFSIIPSFNSNLLSDRFTQMDNLFSRLTGEKPLAEIPTYNLIQKDKENYEMVVSVPGYSQEELDISVLNNQLTISSKITEEIKKLEEVKENFKWIHQGIKRNSFSISFNLDHRIIIKDAFLSKGLLKLDFVYDIPEKEKPQKIAIGIRENIE